MPIVGIIMWFIGVIKKREKVPWPEIPFRRQLQM